MFQTNQLVARLTNIISTRVRISHLYRNSFVNTSVVKVKALFIDEDHIDGKIPEI